MAKSAPDKVKAIGFTAGYKKVALQFECEGGKPLIIEFPVGDLERLGVLTAQVAEKSTAGREPHRPHRLEVWKWEAAPVEGEDMIVLRLHLVGGGSYAFRFGRAFATGLRDGIDEALGFPVVHTSRPN